MPISYLFGIPQKFGNASYTWEAREFGVEPLHYRATQHKNGKWQVIELKSHVPLSEAEQHTYIWEIQTALDVGAEEWQVLEQEQAEEAAERAFWDHIDAVNENRELAEMD